MIVLIELFFGQKLVSRSEEGDMKKEKRPIVIQHRCNTRQKLLDALEGSWVEVDLMITIDGYLVVGHPNSFRANRQTYSYLCEQFSECGDGERTDLITFGELVGIAREKNLHLVLDLKYEEMGAIVAQAIKDSDLVEEDVTVISWSQEDLMRVRRESNNIRTGWAFRGALIDPAGHADRLFCDVLITFGYYLTSSFLGEFEGVDEDDLQLWIVDVNGIDALRVALEANVSVVMSDNAELVRSLLPQ